MTAVVRRVNGPLIEVDGLAGAALADLVAIGRRAVAFRPRWSPATVSGAVVQAYEYTGGVRPGDTVRQLNRPLSAPLGPGLLGGVFDGLLRPLADAPAWLAPGAIGSVHRRAWQFTPAPIEGREAVPGAVLGTVSGAGPVEHRVLTPPGAQGTVTLRPAGAYDDDEPIVRIGAADVYLRTWWPVRRPRPFATRLSGADPLLTGQRVLDVLFPIAKGGAAAVPGGLGTGKTVLLQQIAKWSDADVIVYVGCGERGNELADVLDELRELPDPRTGGRLADRTVIIANTSNMPIMAREASIYTGVAVAEYYRDMGYDAVVIADSTSRWAEALREFASRSGDLPAEEGYPAGLASALAAFYERSGRVTTLGGTTGSGDDHRRVWAYPRGSAVEAKGGKDSFYAVDYAARTASELGADVVKVNFPHPDKRAGVKAPYDGQFSTQQAIDAVVRSANRTLVLVSGGERAGDDAMLEKARLSMEAGATGLIFGRSLWQREHDESLRFVSRLREILEKYPSEP